MAEKSPTNQKIWIIVGSIILIGAAALLFYQFKATILLSQPEVDFDYKQTAIVGDTVRFINNSVNVESSGSWEWDFGDDTKYDYSANAIHIYNLQGTYTVTLKYHESSDAEPYLKKQIIVVNNPPVPTALFELPSDSVRTGSRVDFINKSKFATENLWIFDKQGSSSLMTNPAFEFEVPGKYEVRLIVANFIGQVDEFSKTVTVYGSKIAASQSAISSDGYIPKFNEKSLSEALSSLANQGTSRLEKKEIKREILEDSESLTVPISGMTLENFLNKIQLEASSESVRIDVIEILRNRNNKITSIRIRS